MNTIESMFSRFVSKIKTRKVLLFILLSFHALSLIKTDYYFMSPGPPYQWEIDYGK
jgi:hypothetical protein